MAVKRKKKGGSTKRFGARYGRRLRAKVQSIENEQKKKHKCPFCSYAAVRRVASGIWQCKKCSAKFASKAYRVDKFPAIKSIEGAV